MQINLFGLYLKNISFMKNAHKLNQIPKLFFLILKNYIEATIPFLLGFTKNLQKLRQKLKPKQRER